MKTKSSYKSTILLVLALIAMFAGNAQTRISSPYSRFGIGDLQLMNSPVIMGMGGSTVALNSPAIVNFNNPASYHAFEQNSFIFEAGLHNKFSKLKTETLSQNSNYITLGYLMLGFPVTRHWKSSFGLLPYSSLGYKVVDNRIDELTGKTRYNYEGSGGIHQFYWGNSLTIAKNFSAGFNLVYLFGSLESNRSLSFPDSVYMLGTKVLNTTTVSDLKISTGLQFNQNLNDAYRLTLGLTFSPEVNINAKAKELTYNYFIGANLIDNITDTLVNIEKLKGDFVLPTDFGAGIMLKNSNRWLIKADYKWQNWENFKMFDRSDSLVNSMSVSAGAQILPVYTTISPYWKKIHYRFGFRYSQTYVELNNTRLKEFGISFGTGLPLVRTRSTINIGFEAGSRGTIRNGLIRESFFKLSLGVSVFDRWFEQRKYF